LCRSNPQDRKACPVSRDDLKEVYNALIKHVDKNKFGTDFLTAFKVTQTKMKDYQKQYKARRSKILKEPFTMPDAPNIVEHGVAVHGKKELQDIDMHLRFDQDDIDKYESLNAKPEFLNRCQSKEMCQNLLSWIALELRFLHICDALPTHAQKTIDRTEDESVSALAAGGGDDDGDDGDGEDQEVDGAGGAPKSLTACEDIHNFLHWNVLELDGIAFDKMELGDAAQTAAKKSFHAACILFFYSDHLTKKYSAVSNALHAAWKYQFKKVMQPDDLKRPPLIYDSEETNWCAATIDFLERQLTDDERVTRSLPQRRASARAAPAAARRLLESPAVVIPVNAEDDDDLDDGRL
jgi:hypothetical protein